MAVRVGVFWRVPICVGVTVVLEVMVGVGVFPVGVMTGGSVKVGGGVGMPGTVMVRGGVGSPPTGRVSVAGMVGARTVGRVGITTTRVASSPAMVESAGRVMEGCGLTGMGVGVGGLVRLMHPAKKAVKMIRSRNCCLRFIYAIIARCSGYAGRRSGFQQPGCGAGAVVENVKFPFVLVGFHCHFGKTLQHLFRFEHQRRFFPSQRPCRCRRVAEPASEG